MEAVKKVSRGSAKMDDIGFGTRRKAAKLLMTTLA
jgi:hypothetical protein